MVLNARIKKNEAKVISSAASFQSDADTLRDAPRQERSMLCAMIDGKFISEHIIVVLLSPIAMKHIAPKQ